MTSTTDAAEEPVSSAITLEFIWRGITIEVVYAPDWLGSAGGGRHIVSHLAVTSVNPERAPLPITETGYRSHFHAPGEIEALGGPEAYVTAWLEQEAKNPRWRDLQAKSQQLDLFR